MKAAVITGHGGPDKFKFQEMPAPEMIPGGVRVRVKAAGINFADVMMRMGLYPEAPKPPFIPGYEAAGEVVEVADGVTSLKAGDQVLAFTKFGGYSSELVLPAMQVKKIPAGLSMEEAAGIPVVYATAWTGLMEMARVREGDRVLVYAASGGAGSAALQIASKQGAHVVGLTSSEKKFDYIRSMGASEVRTYAEWEDDSDKKNYGWDIVLDSAGGKNLKRSYQRLKPTGRVVTFGMSELVGKRRSLWKAAKTMLNAPLFPPMKLMMANKGVFGLNMLKLADHIDEFSPVFDRFMQAYEKHGYKTHIGRTFPAEQAGEAQEFLQSRGNVGKVVLTF